MPAFKDLEVKRIPQGVQVQYPKALFGTRKFDTKNLRELQGVHKAILGRPGLHEGWRAFYRYDKKERVLKIRFTEPGEELESPWERLGSA